MRESAQLLVNGRVVDASSLLQNMADLGTDKDLEIALLRTELAGVRTELDSALTTIQTLLEQVAQGVSEAPEGVQDIEPPSPVVRPVNGHTAADPGEFVPCGPADLPCSAMDDHRAPPQARF